MAARNPFYGDPEKDTFQIQIGKELRAFLTADESNEFVMWIRSTDVWHECVRLCSRLRSFELLAQSGCLDRSDGVKIDSLKISIADVFLRVDKLALEWYQDLKKRREDAKADLSESK